MTTGAALRELTREVRASIGARAVAAAIVLMAVSALAEGAGLMLLIPLLRLFGAIDAAGTASGATATSGLGRLGLAPALTGYVILVVGAAWIVRARAVRARAMELAFADALRARLHAALLAMEWRDVVAWRRADFSQAIFEDAGRAGFALHELLRLAAAGLLLPVLLAVSVVLSPGLTLAAAALGGLAALAARPLNRRIFHLGTAQHQAEQALHGDLADDLAGLLVVKSHGLEAARHRRFVARLAAIRDSGLRSVASLATERAATQTLAAIATALFVAVAVRGLAMRPTDALVLLVALARLAGRAMALQDGARNLLRALPSCASLAVTLDACERAAEPAGHARAAVALSFARVLRLEGIVFGYAGQARPALAGIDAEIRAETMTAIVGASGAGKSTLADVLLGLLSPQQGRLLVDGRPLAGAARAAWRRSVAYVPQGGFLFHDTIRANLANGAPDGAYDGGEAALWRALEMAAADDIVRALPRGLDTVAGDQGCRLSGGERQRLTLARALLRRPALLILDEPTSALDAESERRVLDALLRFRRHAAVVVIAHRPAIARASDTVIVLAGGRVVAAGPWTALPRHAAPLLERPGLV